MILAKIIFTKFKGDYELENDKKYSPDKNLIQKWYTK